MLLKQGDVSEKISFRWNENKFGQLHLFGMECNDGEMISKKFISDLRHDS